MGQNQWLKEAIVNIKRNAYGLRKAMVSGVPVV